MTSTIVIAVLSCTCFVLALGILLYLFRKQIKKGCQSAFHRKKRVHQITAPVRASSDNEIVLAVTQRRENVPPPGSSVGRSNPPEPFRLSHHNFTRRPLTPHPLSRHESLLAHHNTQVRRPTLGSGSDIPSPSLVSNMSSLQSLLMSSQVAVFNSSTERLSLSSQNQLIFQPISSLHQQLLHNQFRGSIGGVSPFSMSPAVSNSSSVHLPQPSYFDEQPPTYQESMVIRKLRASDRSTSSRVSAPHRLQRNSSGVTNNNVNFTSRPGVPNVRRSCRM